jgi:DNA helicase-2/ATP-dependent DNA helicase PcrA
MFPSRSGHDPKIITRERPDYVAIRESTWRLIKAGHVSDPILATYSRILIDEHQDCSVRQHAIIFYLAKILPTCIVGDPLQSIFGFDPRDGLADWNEDVATHFPVSHTLDTPWRWINVGCEELGRWLLNVRTKLLARQPIDLTVAPRNVEWIQLNGTGKDYPKQLTACRTNPPDGIGSVLILGNSRSPQSQRAFASQTPGAVTVESVDLRDLTAFARDLDINDNDALSRVVHFAESVMTSQTYLKFQDWPI